MKRNLYLDQLGKKSLEAARSIFNLDEKRKNKVLNDYIKIINTNKNKIINQNKIDIKNAEKKKIKSNLIERSILN